jgi:hypothetical protein
VAMVPLYMLYNFAYLGQSDWGFEDSLFGRFLSTPILEIRDTSFFTFDYSFDVGKGLYNYNLTISPSKVSRKSLMSAMQKSLEAIFNYEVLFETRSLPVWKLTAKLGAVDKLKTKGGDRFASPGTHIAGFTMNNWPPEYLIGCVSFI